jgi:hypothetical protein
MLFDDILLEICRHYLCATPRLWCTLASVCQRWRKLVFSSSLGLVLRLYCTHGRPVLRTLDHFPPVPLIVNYGGSPELNPPAPEDEENIMAALKQSDRVNSISLTVTETLVENLSTISEPFSTLGGARSSVQRRPAADITQHFSVEPSPPYSSLDQDRHSHTLATIFSSHGDRRSSAP